MLGWFFKNGRHVDDIRSVDCKDSTNCTCHQIPLGDQVQILDACQEQHGCPNSYDALLAVNLLAMD